MKLNLVFLLVAVVLSVISKVLQLVYKARLGDLIVIPAAIFFVLAILFSVERFVTLIQERPAFAWQIAFWCCAAVVSFQLTTLVTFGYGQKLGLLFIVPLLVSVTVVVYKVMQ